MAQTAYNDALAAGVAGDLGADDDRQIQTYLNTTEDVPFGRACAKIAATDNGVDLPSTAGDLIVGVAVRKQDSVSGKYAYDSVALCGEPVNVLRKGTIYVEVDEAVTPDDDVFVRFAAEVHEVTITADKDFTAGDEITGYVNGVAITKVTYGVSHDATLAALAVELAKAAVVASATVTGAKEITVVGNTEALELDIVLTAAGGAAPALVQATVSGPSDSDKLGVFRTDAADTGAGACAVALATAKFLTSVDAGGVAVLDINIP